MLLSRCAKIMRHPKDLQLHQKYLWCDFFYTFPSCSVLKDCKQTKQKKLWKREYLISLAQYVQQLTFIMYLRMTNVLLNTLCCKHASKATLHVKSPLTILDPSAKCSPFILFWGQVMATWSHLHSANVWGIRSSLNVFLV